MLHTVRALGIALALFAFVVPGPVTAQQPTTPPAMPPAMPPDFAQFGFPTTIVSAYVVPDQAVSLSVGPQSVTIRPGTFDTAVVFDLLVEDPARWQPMVQGRTVKAAFAFRVKDATTGARIGMFRQPVMYSYTGSDAMATDTILDTTAANPPVIRVNPVPITFDGKVNHPFVGAGVGWLTVSATRQ